jgi:microcystin-dependent protein
MAEPFLGEIRTFAFDFAPSGWAICDGRLLNIAQNSALFTLLGTYYGGNGTTNFGLPDLQGRVPRHKNTTDNYGQKSGVESLVITQAHMPAHTHEFRVSTAVVTTNDPANNVLGKATIYADVKNTAPMAATTLAPSPGTPHNNMQPSLVVNFCIALQGIFPTRN